MGKLFEVDRARRIGAWNVSEQSINENEHEWMAIH